MVFAELLGQPKAVQLLGRALAGGRLAHAYLFIGPDGVGKATAARSMAAALFCREGPPAAPCRQCGGCRKFFANNHPDFHHILPQGAVIKIDQVRGLKKLLSFPPLESGLRVILLEDVHTMRREAANSLLKLLEEPPPGNLLLLTADESEPLLPTILSRCQTVPFHPLPPAVCADILMRMDISLDRERARALAALTGGCPGKIRSLDTENLTRLLDEFMNCLAVQAESEAEAIETALLLAARTAEIREGLETLLDLFLLFFKEAMAAHLGRRPADPERHSMAPYVVRARERWNLDQLSDKIQAVEFAREALARNCTRQMVCEVLFLRLLTGDKPNPGPETPRRPHHIS
ncbi:MAG TPA: DNA polymerase III subunit delta' [Desulfobacteraceae bacterium]|nr:DNA polymerase III subunit delta' [Desulfobacteraceae bacterium]